MSTYYNVRGQLQYESGSVNLQCALRLSGLLLKSQSALSCTKNRHERYRQGNSVKFVPFNDHKRGPTPLMKIDAKEIGPNRAK